MSSSPPVVAGRKNVRDGGDAAGFNLITNQPKAAKATGGAAARPVGRQRPPAQDGQASGKLNAREESTTYDVVTGQVKSSPRKPVARVEQPAAAAKAAPRRAPAAAAKAPEVDVLGRERPASPRKRGTGKSTITFMDEAGGGVNPVTGELVGADKDPSRTAKAKKELVRKLSDKNLDPVTHKQRPAAAAATAGSGGAPYGTDASSEPSPQKPSSVRRIERETRELHKDVNPLTGEKKKVAAVPRSTSGQFKRETAVSEQINPITSAKAPPSPRKRTTTGAFAMEQQDTGRDVDIHGNPKAHGHARRSSSGFISRQVAENQAADPVTGRVVDKAPTTHTKGRLNRELSDRAVNPITGQ